MKYRFTVLLLFFCSIGFVADVFSADYYWVGNGGSWGDTNHWSKVSGSTNPNDLYDAPPTKDDNVFFDGGSFSIPNQEVILSIGDNHCYNMSWTGVTNKPTLRFPSAISRLNVYYSLVLNNNMSVVFQGAENLAVIRMLNTGIDASGFIAAVSTRKLLMPNIDFAGINGIWALTEDLNVAGEINITEGKFQSGAPSSFIFNVTTENFLVDGANVILDIARMNINAKAQFQIRSVNSINIKQGSNTSFISTPLFSISAPGSLTFGRLNITGANGILDAPGRNLTFAGNVSLTATQTNTILGGHFFEADLILSALGSVVRFEAGVTQTLDQGQVIQALGTNCSNYITLQSTLSGSEAIIAKNPQNKNDVVRLSYVNIQDLHIDDGGVTYTSFEAVNSNDLGNTNGWDISGSSGITFFWVGDGGNWSDGSHWSLTSGGVPINCIPGFADDVVFDRNSFSGSNQKVVVNLPAVFFNSMTWTDPEKDRPEWITPAGNVNIGGSLTLAPSMILTLGSLSSTHFNFVAKNAGQIVKAIDTAKDGFDLGNVTFNGSGSWTLDGALTSGGNINFKMGTFSTGTDHNIFADQVIIDGSNVNMTLNSSEILVSAFKVVSVGKLDAGNSNIFTVNLFDITPPNLVFSELILLGTQGTLRGTDLTFEDVKLRSEEKSTVFGSHTYTNELQFDHPGMTVEFEAGTTQKVNNLFTPVSVCGDQILVRTTQSGVQVTFEALAARTTDITISNILLQDNAALTNTNGVLFLADASLDLGNNSNWSFSGGGVASRNFYWIGNTGNWSNGNKWSFTPGGDAANCVPTPSDNVFFDENSFSSPGQTITLDREQQYCRNMDWSAVTNAPTMLIPFGKNLNIFGSLVLDVPVGDAALAGETSGMKLDFNGNKAATIWFRATQPGQTVNLNGHSLPNIDFEGAGGEWSLLSELLIDNKCTLSSGSLNTNGKGITAKQFLVNGSNAALALANSQLAVSESFTITAINQLDAGFSRILTNIFTSNVEGLTFYTVRLIGEETELSGDKLTFDNLLSLQGRRNVIHGSHTFNGKLWFNIDGALAFFIFDVGSVQTLAGNGELLSTGTETHRAIIQTAIDGQTADFFKAGGGVCLEFANIFDIRATGGAIFGLVKGTLTNALNWVQSQLASCGIFLPVECTDFTATLEGDNSAALYWTTAQEVNNRGFEVQRSTDGRRFQTIAWIEGAGTTTETQQYRYIDYKTQGLKTVYYRLLQVDLDGSSDFACNIIALTFSSRNGEPLQLFPNPVGAQLQIKWFSPKEGLSLLRLFDQQGRLILQRQWSALEGPNQQVLSIADLPSGVYEFQLMHANGQMEGSRLVKQ